MVRSWLVSRPDTIYQKGALLMEGHLLAWIIPQFVKSAGGSVGEVLRHLLVGLVLEMFRWYLAHRKKNPWLDRYVVTVVLAWLFLWLTTLPVTPA